MGKTRKVDFCEELEGRIQQFYCTCENILARSVVFVCFVELGKFLKWLLGK